MKEITHQQLMRAIMYHRLNVGSDPVFIHHPYKGLKQYWKWLDYEKYGKVFAVETCHENQESQCDCDDNFYDKYIITVPDDALRCRTCEKFGNCDIQRKDIESYCCLWQKEIQIFNQQNK